MAHNVKCKVCGITFDRDKEEAVPVGGRRYAHAHCVENYERPQEEIDLENLHAYLKELFKDNYDYLPLNKQIEAYVKQGYKVSGILGSLIYFYDIQGNSVAQSKNRIGIVPYVYLDAKRYYQSLEAANKRNANKNLKEYMEVPVREIKIPPPKVDIPKFRLFDLGDD